MNYLMNTLRTLPALLASLVLTGCFALKARPDPSRFYVLGSGSETNRNLKADCPRQVLVGPVTLAGHLDRPRIATRTGENEILYSEWHFWAAPLVRALPRELINSLAAAVPDACVFSYRKATPVDGSLHLELLIDHFEMTSNGNVIVAANWDVTSNGEKRRQGRARISRPYEMGVDEFGSGVQALSVALDELSKKIAEDLH